MAVTLRGPVSLQSVDLNGCGQELDLMYVWALIIIYPQVDPVTGMVINIVTLKHAMEVAIIAI